jgi:hypothetical protein
MYTNFSNIYMSNVGIFNDNLTVEEKYGPDPDSISVFSNKTSERYVYMYLLVFMYLCVYVCVYMYMYIYIYMYKYIYKKWTRFGFIIRIFE